MDSNLTRLTVLFEAPFWVGIFERIEGNTLSVCKVTFGAEPKDYEVLAYVLKNHSRLRFSPSVAAAIRPDAANPKRMQRQIRKQTAASTVGTRSQQALQLQREAQKLEKQTRSREQREEEKQRRFTCRQQKRKERKSTGANRWVYVRQYCAKIDEAARNRMELIVRSLAEQNGVTEQLKADNQMDGCGR